MPQPPEKENKLLTWPNWPMKMRTSSSQEEGAERDFAVNTVSFEGEDGEVVFGEMELVRAWSFAGEKTGSKRA